MNRLKKKRKDRSKSLYCTLGLILQVSLIIGETVRMVHVFAVYWRLLSVNNFQISLTIH